MGGPPAERPRVAVLEWLHPLFNTGHWTPQLVEFAGGQDCLGNPFAPSTTISWRQLADSRAGLRLVDSLEILAHGLHPDVHPPAAQPLLAPLHHLRPPIYRQAGWA